MGANTGEWTIEAHSKFPNTKIHCFELSHSTYDILKNRLEKKTNVTLNNKGLSDKEGIVKYKDYGTGSGITSLIVDFDKFDRNHEYKIVEGYCILGDHYCEINKISEIDLLKIDVEGAENLVLEGFKNMLKNQKIKIIQFEYGYPNGDAHFLMKDFYKYLNKFGYIIGKLRPGGVQFQKFSYNLNDFKSGPNFIAVLEKEEKIIKKIRY